MLHPNHSDPRQNPLYLLFWPIFALRYLLIENCNPAKIYHPVHCTLDDRIPFLEGFLIPYVLWYFLLIGIHLWLYIGNDPAFQPYSVYLILSTLVSTVVFLLYPTSQNLRPAVFPRANGLTEAVKLLYRLDTSTNVCPSEHVIGSVGFFLAALYSKSVCTKEKLLAGAAALLTSVSTVFLKQHSAVDVLAAVPVCLIAWYGGFFRKLRGEMPLK